ncbi:hypothetical protein OG21DRAFT_1504373 [Imleria badia]|nr:hypothetical protein OG21DRAFT_1504373 [Imleria badia]
MVLTCHRCHGSSFDYEEANLKRCSGCRKVCYCSTACQDYDWVYHIFDCNPRRPINTADYLARAARDDVLPVHPQTCEDYGFDRAITDEEKSKLISLYIGLIIYLRIPPKTIHNWRVRGELVDQIKATYTKLPEESRGEYFPWFLQNQHIVALAGQPLFRDMSAISTAWRYTEGSELDSVEEIEAAIARKPEEEQKCHGMYVFLFSKGLPPPELDIWVDFGFASCKSHQEELELGTRYRKLITTCTFKEFCEAFRAHALLGLFHFKGVPNDHRYLGELLGGDWKKSVWYLKQSVRQEDSTNERSNMHPAVLVDYGFMNCRNGLEWLHLKRVYKAFFDSRNGDPIALHEAAIQGNIHGYVSTVVDLRDPMVKRLMQNPYPLPESDW